MTVLPFAALGAAIAAAMVMLLIRAAKGPGLFNRVLAINTFGTLTVLLLVLLGVEFDQHDLMDIALLYVLLNFVAAVAVLRFFEDRRLPAHETHADESHE